VRSGVVEDLHIAEFAVAANALTIVRRTRAGPLTRAARGFFSRCRAAPARYILSRRFVLPERILVRSSRERAGPPSISFPAGSDERVVNREEDPVHAISMIEHISAGWRSCRSW